MAWTGFPQPRTYNFPGQNYHFPGQNIQILSIINQEFKGVFVYNCNFLVHASFLFTVFQLDFFSGNIFFRTFPNFVKFQDISRPGK
jgi:hypothetical protein